MGYCECGCGQETKGRFVPGHDSKHRSRLLREWRQDGVGKSLEELRQRGWLDINGVDNRTFGVEIECMVPTDTGLGGLEDALRAAGIEVFVEHYNHHTRPHWKMVSDSSIRAFDGYVPLELVSPVLKGTAGRDQLRQVCGVLKREGVRVNRTCGLHIHHGANDLGLQGLKDLFLIYMQNEEQIDKMVAPSRRGDGNQYCHSLLRTRPHWVQHSTSLDELLDVLSDRYVKLNFQSYRKYGTVEVRQHQGTVDAEKILAWVDFGQSMLRAAKRAGSAELFGHSIWDILEMGSERVTYWMQRMEALAA